MVRKALEAGKHVYCEWPLGNGLREAEELAALAKAHGVLGVVGNQAQVAPEVLYAKQLIAAGGIGEVLSTTLVASGGQWGGIVPDKKNGAYLLDRDQGATMLTIPVGHTLAGVQEALGPIEELSSVLTTRRRTAKVAGTGEELLVTAPDQVLVSGVLANRAPIALHYRGGLPRDGRGFLWEINGTGGDIRIMAPVGHLQLALLTIEVAQGDAKAFSRPQLPPEVFEDLPGDPVPYNVARLYVRMGADFRDRTRTAPTFDDAVRLRRVLAAIAEGDR